METIDVAGAMTRSSFCGRRVSASPDRSAGGSAVDQVSGASRDEVLQETQFVRVSVRDCSSGSDPLEDFDDRLRRVLHWHAPGRTFVDEMVEGQVVEPRLAAERMPGIGAQGVEQERVATSYRGASCTSPPSRMRIE